MGVVLPQPIPFGKYTLFERIGRGGMADVFKARIQGPEGFERVFVVKRILGHLSGDPHFIKMFVDEAKMSARLSHPNVVQVFELGEVEGEYFIAMEYVRGRDLAETGRTLWSRLGPPRPDLVAYIGREMCRALAYAHDLTGDDGRPLGMIHRDISPSNVMLSYEGAVKILDFGIAKALGGDKKESGTTQSGTLKGKFAYMAPEQTVGEEVDRRIDIFATGIVLHEILSGRRLFKGENDMQTVEKVRACDVPPPSKFNALCPPELDAAILKALARNRDDRFGAAADFADALDDVVHMTRFGPSHLAQVLRDLFPSEAGPGDGRPTRSLPVTGSLSRPPTGPTRSPTVPPIMAPPAYQSDLAQAAAAAARGERSPLSRGATWAVIGVVAAAFVGGGVLMRSKPPPPPPVAATATRTVVFPLVIDSIPDGANVYQQETGTLLGKTPLMLKDFEWRADKRYKLIFRLAGYEESEREVMPHQRIMVTLTPAAKKGRPTVAPLPSPPAEAPPADQDRPAATGPEPSPEAQLPGAAPADPAAPIPTPPAASGAERPRSGLLGTGRRRPRAEAPESPPALPGRKPSPF